MPTKVTFLIPGFADGGAQRQCILLLNALRNDPDLELRLIHFYDGVHFELLNREGLAIQRFDSTSNYDPRNLLLEYQFAWREDKSRFKAGLMSRQSGKDFSSESEAAEDCHANPKTTWMIAAPSERQALDSLEQLFLRKFDED